MLPSSLACLLRLFRATKDFIHAALTAHLQLTGSVRAAFVLDHFEDALTRFWVVIPASEKENPLLSLSINVSEHTLTHCS